MEFIVFIVFLLLMEVQSYKSPTVKVSPEVIRESSSVKISCEMPADVKVNKCHFYPNREEKNIKVSSSCELELTGAEVLRWAAVKSPVSININCYYTIHERGSSSASPPATVTVLDSLQKPFISVSDDDVQLIISCEIPLSVRADFICSLYTEDDDLLYQCVSQRSQSGGNHCMFYLSHSELFTRSVNSRQLTCVYSLKTEPEIRSAHSDTYTIRDLPQAKLRASASVILETDTVQLSCENTEDLKMEMCFFNINGRENNSGRSSSCQLSLTGSQISIWSGGQSSYVRITCFYTVMKRQVQKPSAHSDPVTVTVQISTSTTTEQTTTTAMKTSLSVMSTSKTTGVAVILPGLMGLICLCWFANEKRRKRNKTRSIKPEVTSQGIGMSCSGSAETYSLITSVPATSQPISGGLEHPESHQNSTADPTDTRSFIMSVNSIYQPSDVLVNKQQKQGNPEENEIVYHLYCMIPDKPVHSNARDQVYSLVKMH